MNTHWCEDILYDSVTVIVMGALLNLIVVYQFLNQSVSLFARQYENCCLYNSRAVIFNSISIDVSFQMQEKLILVMGIWAGHVH